jgi:pyridoxal phosphate enzyme (YggS family)
MNIGANIEKIKQEIPSGVILVAVSKTKPASAIQEAYESGHRDFGENKVQELVAKAAELPKDINWHLIGHLQTNKVKYIAPFVHLIHSVDSLKLLEEINKHALKHNRIIDCLLQVYIAKEETKFGLDQQELTELLASSTSLSGIRIRGLMGMASNTNDVDIVGAEFKQLKTIFDNIANEIKSTDFNILSMGMSSDYQLAITNGSNMIRLGSTIFGERNYPTS